MAVLSDADRQAVAYEIMRLPQSVRGTVVNCTKADIKAAADATDQWIEDNQGAYNNALSPPWKNNATVKQKAILFAYIALKRYGVL